MGASRLLFLWLVFAPNSMARSRAGQEEGLLAHGQNTVGFVSSWELDHGRTYRTAFDQGATYGAQKAPRPILVNRWYPAVATAGKAMPHGSYFEIGSSDEHLAPLARALSDHARRIFVQEVLQQEEEELGPEGLANLERLLATPTACHAGAKPATGPFPLVLFHSGAGSSFEDNAAFCAYLASHGYVVLGSAYLDATGESLGVDGREGSAEDLAFLIRHARQLPSVDWNHVAIAGHSLGAQAALRYGTRPGIAADMLVLLDTTQDYYGLALPTFEGLVNEVRKTVEHLTTPLLVAASPGALFELMDGVVNADRAYLTVPTLGHNDFISQGLQCLAELEYRLARDPGLASDPIFAKDLARAPDARAKYRALCEYVRLELDARLRGEEEPLAAQRSALLETTLGEALHVELVPRGVSGPEAYDLESERAPSPRQLLRLIRSDTAAARSTLERFQAVKPQSPVYDSTMLMGSLLYELHSNNQLEEARHLLTIFRASKPTVLSLFDFLANMSELMEHPEQAEHYLRVSLELDPAQEEVKQRLREMEGGAEASPR